MPADLFRIVYYSRKAPPLGDDETAGVQQILTVARGKNARLGVTGALMFNSGCFAQVLEGGQAPVETTFNRIAFDPRHSGIVLLEAQAAAERHFPHWSMAFVGEGAAGQRIFAPLATQSGFDDVGFTGDELFRLLRGMLIAGERPAG